MSREQIHSEYMNAIETLEVGPSIVEQVWREYNRFLGRKRFGPLDAPPVNLFDPMISAVYFSQETEIACKASAWNSYDPLPEYTRGNCLDEKDMEVSSEVNGNVSGSRYIFIRVQIYKNQRLHLQLHTLHVY